MNGPILVQRGKSIIEGTGPLEEIRKKYPRLGQYLSNVQITQGKPAAGDTRQLEFYPPWESENPQPGKITIELLRQFGKDEGATAIAGDLLHYVGAVDPRSGKPIDPEYWKLKQEVFKARTSDQQLLDKRVYEKEVAGGEKRSFEDWWNQSRGDAYIRGWVTPDATDEWRKQGFYESPRMRQAVESIQHYLQSAK